MIKEFYTLAEAAKILGISKQSLSRAIIRGSCKNVIEEEDNCQTRQGKKLKIPLYSLFYGIHKDLVIWDEPYKDSDKWKIKSYDIRGLHEHDIS